MYLQLNSSRINISLYYRLYSKSIIKNLALDSEEVLTIENKFPRKFHNLNVWIGDPVLAPAKAIIRNVCVKTASEPPADSNVTIARVSNEFVELFYKLL